MAWGLGADEFVTGTQARGGVLKAGKNLLIEIGKAIGKLKAIVGLHTLDSNAAASKPSCHIFSNMKGRHHMPDSQWKFVDALLTLSDVQAIFQRPFHAQAPPLKVDILLSQPQRFAQPQIGEQNENQAVP